MGKHKRNRAAQEQENAPLATEADVDVKPDLRRAQAVLDSLTQFAKRHKESEPKPLSVQDGATEDVPARKKTKKERKREVRMQPAVDGERSS